MSVPVPSKSKSGVVGDRRLVDVDGGVLGVGEGALDGLAGVTDASGRAKRRPPLTKTPCRAVDDRRVTGAADVGQRPAGGRVLGDVLMPSWAAVKVMSVIVPGRHGDRCRSRPGCPCRCRRSRSWASLGDGVLDDRDRGVLGVGEGAVDGLAGSTSSGREACPPLTKRRCLVDDVGVTGAAMSVSVQPVGTFSVTVLVPSWAAVKGKSLIVRAARRGRRSRSKSAGMPVPVPSKSKLGVARGRRLVDRRRGVLGVGEGARRRSRRRRIVDVSPTKPCRPLTKTPVACGRRPSCHRCSDVGQRPAGGHVLGDRLGAELGGR